MNVKEKTQPTFIELKERFLKLKKKISESAEFSKEDQMLMYGLLVKLFYDIRSYQNLEEKKWYREQVLFFQSRLQDCKDPLIFSYVPNFSIPKHSGIYNLAT